MAHKANRYPGECGECGETVAAGAGLAVSPPRRGMRWSVVHTACLPTESRWVGSPISGRWVDTPVAPTHRVITTRFSSGAVVTRNARGRCEDAPCCGCCT